jgi:hypothetical protein
MSRTETTAPLSVSFSGCGSWNTDRTPFNLTRTRDPFPYVTIAPNATNNRSISVHKISERVGVSKIVAKIFFCLLLSAIRYILLQEPKP